MKQLVIYTYIVVSSVSTLLKKRVCKFKYGSVANSINAVTNKIKTTSTNKIRDVK